MLIVKHRLFPFFSFCCKLCFVFIFYDIRVFEVIVGLLPIFYEQLGSLLEWTERVSLLGHHRYRPSFNRNLAWGVMPEIRLLFDRIIVYLYNRVVIFDSSWCQFLLSTACQLSLDNWKLGVYMRKFSFSLSQFFSLYDYLALPDFWQLAMQMRVTHWLSGPLFHLRSYLWFLFDNIVNPMSIMQGRRGSILDERAWRVLERLRHWIITIILKTI